MKFFGVAATAALTFMAMTGQAFAFEPPVNVPEPASLAPLAFGAGGIVLAKLRRRK